MAILSDIKSALVRMDAALFQTNLRGVVDKKFFLFRIPNLFAYP